MMPNRRRALACLVSSMLCLALPQANAQTQSQAQAYPTRPVKIVVGYAPGGAADIAARMLAEWMTSRLGQPFVVENRPGASGTLAANQVSKSPADGYTLFYGPGFGMTMGSGESKIEYKPDQLFQPVNLMLELPMLLVVNNDLPVKRVQDLIVYTKSKGDGALNYASYGKGTTSHLASEALKSQANLKVEHILYKGSAPAIVALRAGEVQMMFDTAASAAPHVKAGAIRALGVTSANRLVILPDVPTMREAGLPEVSMSSWMGLFAPKGTPPAVVQALSQAVSAYLAQPATRDRIANMGFVAQDKGPEAFRELIIAETQKIDNLVKRANINLD